MLNVLLAVVLGALVIYLHLLRERVAVVRYRMLLRQLLRLEACVAVVWTSINERGPGPVHLREFDDFVPGPLAKPSLHDLLTDLRATAHKVKAM